MGLSCWAKGKKNLESPGPAAYLPPPPFGSGPHYTLKGRARDRMPDPEPPIISLPSTLVYRTTTFGCRPKPRPIDITPAPNGVAEPIGRSAPKYSFRTKYEEPPNGFPGPADYTVSREFPGPKQSISSGPRTDFIDENIIAPPGVYDLPVLFQKQKDLTIGPFIPRPEPERNGPGPSKYKADTTIGRDTPLYTVPKGERDPPRKDSPGPADYQRIRPLTSETQISMAFKWRTPLPHGDLCDYPYHKYPGCINARKFSHGVRPETCYETMGPGPGSVTKKPAIEERDITIGKVVKHRDPNERNPGPAEYFKTEIPPAPLPTCGFYGPLDRCPINIEKEKKKPGPGYYDQEGQFEESRRHLEGENACKEHWKEYVRESRLEETVDRGRAPSVRRYREFDGSRPEFYCAARKTGYYIAEDTGGYTERVPISTGPSYSIGSKDA